MREGSAGASSSPGLILAVPALCRPGSLLGSPAAPGPLCDRHTSVHISPPTLGSPRPVTARTLAGPR